MTTICHYCGQPLANRRWQRHALDLEVLGRRVGQSRDVAGLVHRAHYAQVVGFVPRTISRWSRSQ